ncbi:MAG: hypothetical protein REH79_00910 [Spiroplasma sp.]|nr:hypothetical protein [Spiroplasma sp.]
MKQHLKFLFLSTLTSVPIVSVVACSTTSATSISDQDILNSAEGMMQDHIFNMTYLGLSDLPADKVKYDDWKFPSAKTKIAEFYRDLVTNNLNWAYPTVTVDITSGEPLKFIESSFINKYGPKVEARINLVAKLSFKGLTSSVPIVVKITNNETKAQDRIDAIGVFLQNYLNDSNLVFEFKTLLKDNLLSSEPEAKHAYGPITSNLRAALFTSSNEATIPVIDVDGIDFNVLPIGEAEPAKTIYTLNDSSAVQDDTINGTLKNLTLQIIDKNTVKYNNITLDSLDKANQSLKVQQKFADANNQIGRILNQGPDGLKFEGADLPGGALPTAGQVLSEYDAGSAFTNKVREKIFSLISKIYPTEKIDGSWTQAAITFPTANSSEFVLESDENPSDNIHFGYFLVTLDFESQIGGKTIKATISNIKLNLKVKTS